ncbi:hypothetical protein Tco_1437727 [Tanacetum coccineum]
MLKMVPETPLQFGVAERLSRTFRAESTGIRVEAPKMLWADSVSTTYLIYRIPYVPIGLRIPEEEWRGKDTSLAHLKVIRSRDITFVDSIYGAKSATDSVGASRIVRSNKEDSKDEEFSEEGGSETPQVQRSTRKFRAPVRLPAGKNASQILWMFMVKEEQDCTKRCSKKQVLGYVLTVGITTVEWESGLQKSITIYTKSSFHLVKNLKVGDEREVEVLRSFNWPSSELITDDGVLPERVQKGREVALFKGRKVRAVALLKGRWFEVYRDYLRQIAVK